MHEYDVCRCSCLLPHGECSFGADPKAFTYGCTCQAENYQKDVAEYRKTGAEVIGISTDPVDKLKEFKEVCPFISFSCPSPSLAQPFSLSPLHFVSRFPSRCPSPSLFSISLHLSLSPFLPLSVCASSSLSLIQVLLAFHFLAPFITYPFEFTCACLVMLRELIHTLTEIRPLLPVAVRHGWQDC